MGDEQTWFYCIGDWEESCLGKWSTSTLAVAEVIAEIAQDSRLDDGELVYVRRASDSVVYRGEVSTRVVYEAFNVCEVGK